ncbi:MAG: hypothetical protein AAF480_05515 [Actinomycetota bacterium]
MTVDLDAAAAECGGSVAGTVHAVGGGPVEVHLRWSTSGHGTTDAATVETVELAGGGGRFALPVPEDGPMSFAGKLISVRWEVAALSGDSEEVAEVTILPRGGLTVWVRNVAPPPAG